MDRTRMSRRRFLRAAAAGAAAPYVITSTALGGEGRPPAGERLVMGAIGVGGRGTGDMRSLMGFGEVQMVAVCDPVPAHRDRAKAHVDGKYGNKDCQATADFREIVTRDDIDAILIGTPDHWHAIITIQACKHGKDVYCEKPETLTIREGRAMVEAVKRYGRIFAGGSQRVLGDYGQLPRLVRGGAVGRIKEAYVGCGGPSHPCHLPAEPMPEGLDWNMWLGPTPWRPFHSRLIRGGFRPYREYSGGGMTDWGAHRFGAAMFAIGVHRTGPVEVIPPDGKAHKHLTYVFANGLRMYHAGGNIRYVGTDGDLPGRGVHPVGPVDMKGYRGRGIFGDFVHCARTRQEPFRDIETAHRAASVCHLGNIAYWLKRPLKWDPVREVFPDDGEANTWLDRPRRGPWAL